MCQCVITHVMWTYSTFLILLVFSHLSIQIYRYLRCEVFSRYWVFSGTCVAGRWLGGQQSKCGWLIKSIKTSAGSEHLLGPTPAQDPRPDKWNWKIISRKIDCFQNKWSVFSNCICQELICGALSCCGLGKQLGVNTPSSFWSQFWVHNNIK